MCDTRSMRKKLRFYIFFFYVENRNFFYCCWLLLFVSSCNKKNWHLADTTWATECGGVFLFFFFFLRECVTKSPAMRQNQIVDENCDRWRRKTKKKKCTHILANRKFIIEKPFILFFLIRNFQVFSVFITHFVIRKPFLFCFVAATVCSHDSEMRRKKNRKKKTNTAFVRKEWVK